MSLDYPKTAIQTRVSEILTNSGLGSGVAYDAMIAYIALTATPTAAQTATLISTLYAERENLTGPNYVAVDEVIQVLELDNINQNRIGTVNTEGPLDEVGVTYSTIKADLISALSFLSENTYTALSEAIFTKIKAASPELSFTELSDDIQYTLSDTGLDAEGLASLLVTALGNADATAAGIANALYGNDLIIGNEQLGLITDIIARSKLLTLYQIRTNILDAATDESITTVADFAVALYDASHPVVDPEGEWISSTQLENSISATIATLIENGTAVDEDAGLAYIRSNIATNLGALTDVSSITALLIQGAIYNANAIVPQDPYDLGLDIIEAQTLLNLKTIKTNIIDLIDNYDGDTLASFAQSLHSILQDGTSTDFGSLDETQLYEVLLASSAELSGGFAELISNIRSSLAALSDTALTSTTLVNSLYDTGGLTLSNEYALTQDVIARQLVLNYADMASTLKTALDNLLFAGDDAADSAAFAAAIIDNIGSPTDLTGLDEAIIASASDAGSMSTLRTNISNALDGVYTLSDIMLALFGTDKIISPNPYYLRNTINTGEVLKSYELAIENFISTLENVNSETTAAELATSLRSHISSSTSPSLTDLTRDIQGTIEDGTPIETIASNIITTLQSYITVDAGGLVDPDNYTSAAIKDAFFNVIISGDKYSLERDINASQVIIDIKTIKSSLVEVTDLAIAGDIDSAENLSSAILTAIAGSPGASTLDVQELIDDITVSLTALNITIATLASRIKTALNAIDDNSLTIDTLIAALYNNNLRIRESNSYEISQDIVAKELFDYISVIKTDLINYLTPISLGSDDTTEYTIADLEDAIFNGINTIETSITRTLTKQYLKADIVDTLRADGLGANNYDSGVYGIAANIISNLEDTGFVYTKAGIADTIYATNALVQSTDSITQRGDDSTKLLSDLDTLHTSEFDFYNAIITSILDGITAAGTISDASTLAGIIIDSIDASSVDGRSPKLTTSELAADIQASLDGGVSISDIITNIQTSLGNLPADPTPTEIEDAIFDNLPYLSSEDADALKTDAQTFINSNENITFTDIKNALITSLQTVDGTFTLAQLSELIINTINDLGNSSSLSDAWLSSTRFLTDLQASTNSATPTDLAAALITNLQAIPLESESAATIVEALFGSGGAVLSQVDATNFDSAVYSYAASGINGVPEMVDDIQTALATVDEATTNLQIANLILSAILPVKFGLTPELSAANFALDFDSTAIDIVTLSASISSAIDGSGSRSGLKTDIYGELTESSVYYDNTYVDLQTYEVSREDNFYEVIRDNLAGTGYEDETNTLGEKFVSNLGADGPNLTTTELQADLEANIGAGSIDTVHDCIVGALPSSTPYTSTNIVAAFYTTCLTSLATNDQDGLVSGLQSISTRSYRYGDIATNIYNALDALGGVYTDSTVATAIIRAITPDLANTLNLPLSHLTEDIGYTKSVDGLNETLLTIVNLVMAQLFTLMGITSTTYADVKEAIYYSTRIIDYNADNDHFGYDLAYSRDYYNGYTILKTSLSDLDGNSAGDIASSLQTLLEVPTIHVSYAAVLNDLAASVASYGNSYSTLLTSILSNIDNADVSDMETAATNIRDAIYSGLTTVNEANLVLDVTSANDIDNTPTIYSLLGTTGSICIDGTSSHSFYSCSGTEDSSPQLIATNDCTVIGFLNAVSACAFASALGVDYYNYDGGSTCQTLSSSGDAMLACFVGLNLPNIA